MNNIFTLGADPEAFLYNTDLEMYVPSELYFHGTKDEPEDLAPGYAVLCDNLMVEFNIPPASTKLDFVANLNQAIEFIQQKLPEEVEIRFNNSAVFSDKALQFPTANMFGCAPQENMYNIMLLCPDDFPPNVRFAGGHIHVGMKINNLKKMIKLFDLHIGLPLAAAEPRTELSRRDIYGAPGTYRTTSYGFEYRTPSCEWLQSNDKIEWVWDSVERIVEDYHNEGIFLPDDNEVFQAFEQPELARELIADYA